MDWSRFDNNEALDSLRKELEAMADDGNGGARKEVPVGEYEVTITKIAMKESKSGKPMVSIWMKIVNGAYKGQLIFYNQLINTAFGIHLVKQFFVPFNLPDKIMFESYEQFEKMLITVAEETKDIEFALSYNINDKGYNEFKVTQIFDF